VEAGLSIYLENFATSLGSREQLAIAEFADALLVLPKTLAVNAAKVRRLEGLACIGTGHAWLLLLLAVLAPVIELPSAMVDAALPSRTQHAVLRAGTALLLYIACCT
jgi:hypothetical protein